MLAAIFEILEFEVESVNFLVEAVVVLSEVGGDSRGCSRGGSVTIDGGGGQSRFSGRFLYTFKLAGHFKGFVESGWSRLEKFITERRTEIGDEQIESHVIESSSGAVRH